MPENKHDIEFGNKEDIENAIFDIDGSEPFDTSEHDWSKEWIGMPEFIQCEKPPYQCIKIRFATEEDYKEFAKLIEQNLTVKTKSIWYPCLDRDRISSKRYVDDLMELA